MQESLYSRSTVLGRKLLASVFCGQATAVKTFSRMEFFVKLCPQEKCNISCHNGGKKHGAPLFCSSDGNSDGCTCTCSGNWTGLECGGGCDTYAEGENYFMCSSGCRNIAVNSIQECKDICTSEPQCFIGNYVDEICYLCPQNVAAFKLLKLKYFAKSCIQDNICGLFCMNGGTVSDDCSTCSCVKPWSGPLCSECSIACQNGGTRHPSASSCPNDGNSGGCTCSCSGNWTGLECEFCNMTCGDHGTRNAACDACVCNGSWTGDRCDECNLSCGENEILDTENCICKCKNDYFGSHCDKSCEEDFGAVRDEVFKEMCKSSSQNALLCSKTCGTCTSEFGICVDDKRCFFLRRVAVRKATKSFCSKLGDNECSHICCLVQ